MEYFWKVIEDLDKRVESELIKILENYGWLGISDVGRLANGVIWSTIQHSSIKRKVYSFNVSIRFKKRIATLTI